MMLYLLSPQPYSSWSDYRCCSNKIIHRNFQWHRITPLTAEKLPDGQYPLHMPTPPAQTLSSIADMSL